MQKATFTKKRYNARRKPSQIVKSNSLAQPITSCGLIARETQTKTDAVFHIFPILGSSNMFDTSTVK
jgi:hypothetical protein